MDETIESIEKVEKELQDLVHYDVKAWTKMYMLLQKVESNKLYIGKYRSFTAWLKSFASAANIHESVLWTRLKAGKLYSNYFDRQCQRCNAVIPLEKIQTSPESLNFIAKIAANNADVADDLIPKVIDGKLSKKDLKAAWARVKAEREHKGIKTPTNKYTAMQYGDSMSTRSSISDISAISATDIIVALHNPKWLPDVIYPDTARVDKYHVNKYLTLTEFPVRTGTTRHARRIDLLVAETHTVESYNKMYDLHLHSIEIKVDANDLQQDHKMQEYAYYTDYAWLAVPVDLLTVARDYAADGWGILVITKSNDDSYDVVVDRVARLRVEISPALRVEALSTLINKL